MSLEFNAGATEQYATITGLPEPGGNPDNLIIRVNVATTLTGQGDCIIADGRFTTGTHELHYGGSGTSVFQVGGVASNFNNSGTATDNWGTVTSYFEYLIYNAAGIEDVLRLFGGDTTATRDPLNIDVASVVISNNSGTLATFDLTNPTSSTILNTGGSLGAAAEMELTGFTFGPSFTINEASAAFGDTITFSHSGFGGALTTWTYEDSQGNVTNFINGDEDSADFPSLANDVVRGLTGTVTVTIGDGTDTATDTITLNAPSGYTVQAVLAGFSTTFPSVYQDFTGTVQEGEQSLYVTAEWNSFDGLGGGEVAGPGTYTLYHISLDGTMQSYDIIFGEDGSYRIVRTGSRDTTRGLTRPTYRSV